MKVTLYSRDGKIYEEWECVDVQPYISPFHMVVLVPLPNCPESGKKADYFLTNLPFMTEGILAGREPEPNEAKFTVKMLDDGGKVIRSWENAQGISYLKEVVSFKADGIWHSVCGSVVIQPV